MKKLLIIILALCASLPYAAAISADHVADVIGERGGLVVHVGCEDGSLAASLASNDALVVQELSTDAGTVAKLREKRQANGAYGNATIAQFDGKRLPYVESTVNLLIISDPAQLTGQEIMRVLAPNGMVLLDEGKSVPGLKTKPIDKRKNAQTAQKPWPQEIDEWTHYLHDAQGSSLSNDTVAGAPKGLRWTCGPLWARSHEHTASMNAMVSAGGRVFYVMDEGPAESVQLPAENYLTARDAFNGVELWKRPLPNWFNHLYPLKSGPGWLPRRLVAVGERVYLAPGTGEPLLCLDAATGEVIRRYQDTASTFELIVSDGIVFAAVDPNEQPVDYEQEHPNCWKERDRASKRWGWRRDRGARVIKAMDAESGDTLWQKEMPLVPMTLSADAEKVCFFDGQAILALNKTTGDELWRTAVSPMPHVYTGYAGPRLIMTDKHVVLAPKKEIFVLDAQTGDMVWSVKNKPRSGHYSLEDFFVIGDTVWALGRSNNGKFTTYNLATGDIEKQFSNPIDSFYIHQRCYPGKATKRYLLPPMMGMTTYEMDTNQWDINHWVRGGCIYGSMPANGMVYAGPHACACYYQSKLNGFNAVAPNAQSHTFQPGETRLVKGPAYGRCDKQADYPASAWPAFRHDQTRSGYVKTDIAENVAPAWDKPFNTKLSQAVAADGKVFVSAVDQHTLYALDAASGKEVWRFVAGGRVDSPPTLYKGMALFGCADGCVYALNAANGRLAWKFQAAPNRKLVSYGQLESVWPISGSVLIEDDKLYGVAGRSMFLDGGLRMVILNPETGELIKENIMDDVAPGSGKNLQEFLMGKHMPVAMPDILSSDGKYVYMKSQTFTKDGKRVRIQPQRPDTQYDEEVHLFSPISFLDDSWHQRTYWIFGRAAGEGWAEFQLPPKRVPYGRILCVDEKNAYSFGRDVELLCNTSVSEYRFFSAEKYPKRKVGVPNLEGTRWTKGRYPSGKDVRLAAHTVNWKDLAKQPMDKLTALDYNWIEDEPEIQVKAMVLANDKLFIAGPRDVANEKALWGRSNDAEFQQKMHEQLEWLRGKHGSIMKVVSKTNGETLATYKLGQMPNFDGLIAAEGNLFMTTMDGTLVCFAPKK